MKNKIFMFFVLMLLCSFSFAGKTKMPIAADRFYPGNADELTRLLDGYFQDVKLKEKVVGEILGIVVPHAGYVFSGQTAAYSYSLIKENFDYVIVIGTSHYSGKYGLQTCLYDAFKVPNGEIKSDVKLIKKLISKSKVIQDFQYAYLQEHSVEVQIPFILHQIKNAKIIPFIVSDISVEDAKQAAEVIYDELKAKKVLVIVSSDLSHYPDYDTAVRTDGEVIDSILKMNSGMIKTKCENLVIQYARKGLETAACGENAIIAGIEIMKKFGVNDARLLKYSNSGDVENYGDKSKVVGYAAIVFYNNLKGEKTMGNEKLSLDLSDEIKSRMLKIARDSIAEFLKTGRIKEVREKEKIFNEKYGLFVTLNERGQLRGCIGVTEPIYTLNEALPQIACASAFNDPRFAPVSEKELKDINIEISILSKPEKVKSADEIVMGKHGVIVKKGSRSGLFLPQVAEETGWSKEEFLSNLCMEKAGLPPDAWKNKDTELFVFTVYNFSENGK
ncbi:MAG: AmmeMemoRadiSam system protein B [Candidatus Goldbacteria bacterium]|nr:AmmeMemoRadiSam system protein B [Candidatus Goldiibacteriota bacterium]